MKRVFFSCLVFQLLCTCLTLSAQKKVSILGDSYSTYSGYVTPANNRCFYGDEGKSDVENVEQTWWHLFIAQQGYVLERNNSFSGATVCCTGYSKEDYSDRAFVTRCYDLGNPDIIFVFGGTNDSWAKSPVGEYQYAGWDKESLFAFRPAFAYLLQQLKHLYPSATIINISNSQLSEEVTTSMEVICRRYGIINVQLQNIEKQSGHPSIVGMKSICEQVTAAYKNQSDDRLGGDGHKDSGYLAEIKKELSKKHPQNKTINFVFHGHSVPTGFFKTPVVNTLSAYPHLFGHSVKDKYPYAVVNVITTSIGGENSVAGCKRFKKEVLSHRPDVVFIDYGLNDRYVGLEKSEKAWRRMIKMALKQHIKVFLLTPTPDLSEKLLDSSSPLAKHTAMIKRLADEYQVGLVDSYACFQALEKEGKSINNYMSQQNHINAKGHHVVAEEIMNYF